MEVILTVIFFAATAVIVTSAPVLSEGKVPANTITEQEKQRDYYRDKRSQYQYLSPCAAAAASSPIPAIAPPTYQVNLPPYHPYANPHGYYAAPQYRSADFDPEHEMMSFSDMDHMMSEHIPMARYGYVPPAAAHVPASYAAPLIPPATTGNVFSVFPNANVGGCGVPLLFSCAPSIVPGNLVHSTPHHSYGDVYRGVEALSHHDAQDHQDEPSVPDHLSPVHDQNHAIGHQ